MRAWQLDGTVDVRRQNCNQYPSGEKLGQCTGKKTARLTKMDYDISKALVS